MTEQEMLNAMEGLLTRIVKPEIEALRDEIKTSQQQTMQAVNEQIKASQQQTMQAVNEQIKASQQQTMQAVSEQIKAVQQQTMQDVATLMDAQFMKQFNLLADKLDGVMCKMPSEDDMDIIDGTLQEHGEILKVHSQEIEQLKIAL